MSEMSENKTILSYESYCILFAWMDAHFTREKIPALAFQKTFDDFVFACDNQRRGLIRHQRMVEDLPDDYESTICLLQPRAYVPLGRSDLMGVVLLDSIDECQNLMASVNRTIEEATMAFCLKPEGLLTEELNELLNDHLVSARDVLTDSDRRPLVMLTRLKLEGLPLLLDPILSQTSAISHCLRRIGLAWEALIAPNSAEARDGLFAESDLLSDSWRMCVLDLQEEEEIGLLFTCRNLSVPATLISAIRGLTIGEVCRESADFARLMDRPVTHSILERCQKSFEQQNSGQWKGWSINASHLFRWTRSSVALALDSYEKDAPEVGGFAASLALVSRPPGHHLDGLNAVIEAQDRVATKQGKSPGPFPKEWRSAFLGSIDMLSGSVLDRGESSWLAARHFGPTANVFQAIAELCKSMNVPDKEEPECSVWPTRHVTAWNTLLIVPVPGLLKDRYGLAVNTDYRPVSKEHFPFLLAAIRQLPEKLFQVPGPKQGKHNEVQEGDYILRLREAFGFLGLPMTLRRAFWVLFQRYISLAKDPMRYDSVLDLHDVMHTLWHVLVSHLPAAMWPEMAGDTSTSNFEPSLNRRLTARDVEFLSDLARAIESAIDLRLRRALPDAGDHEWDLDYRGSLNQVVIAGETVLRAALGIVRRNVLGDEGRYDRLGVANRLTITSTIYAVTAGLGVEHQARLAYTDTDVSHLSYMVQLTDYFHEAFHLIFSEMRLPTTEWAQPGAFYVARNLRGRLAGLRDLTRGDDKNSDLFVEMSAEAFVAMMMLILVADGDIDLMWHQQAQAFATSPASALSPSDGGSHINSQGAVRDLHNRFADVFVPMGILNCLLQPFVDANGRVDLERAFAADNSSTNEFLRPSEALALFEKQCQRILCLLPDDFPVLVELADGSKSPRWLAFVARKFDECWGQLSITGVIDVMWKCAVEVSRCFMAESVSDKLDLPAETLVTPWRELIVRADRRIEAWSDGRSDSPVSVTEMFACFNDEEWNNHVLGTVFILRGLNWAWLSYLPDPRQLGIEWRLPRGFKDVKAIERDARGYVQPKVTLGGKEPFINWDPAKRHLYADHLIDPVRPEGFCLRPKARARRLLHQTVFIKTLWSLAAVIRRRRLESMLKRMCGD